MLAPYWKWAGDPDIRMPKCYMKATTGIAPILICGSTEGRKPRHIARLFAMASCGLYSMHSDQGCRRTAAEAAGRAEPVNRQHTPTLAVGYHRNNGDAPNTDTAKVTYTTAHGQTYN